MHFSDLEVCCDWSTFFFSLKSAVRGAGTRDEPLRTSAWEAMFFPVKVPGEFNFNSTNQNIQAPDVYSQNHVNTQVNEVNIYLKCRDLDIKLYS